jgi:hypothetical protein
MSLLWMLLHVTIVYQDGHSYLSTLTSLMTTSLGIRDLPFLRILNGGCPGYHKQVSLALLCIVQMLGTWTLPLTLPNLGALG